MRCKMPEIFICKTCANKNGFPTHGYKTIKTNCEICGKEKICYKYPDIAKEMIDNIFRTECKICGKTIERSNLFGLCNFHLEEIIVNKGDD